MHRQKVIVLVAVLAIASLVPIPYLAAPRWEVWVVGEDGKPLPGSSVRLVYQDYPAERESHEITLATDEQGHVLFPAHFKKASLVKRVGYALQSLNPDLRIRYGRQAFVFAYNGAVEGNDTNGEHVTNWEGLARFNGIQNSGQTSRHEVVEQRGRRTGTFPVTR